MRVIPEKEKPPAMRVDIYCNRSYALCLSCVYPEVAYKTMESIAATADQILPMAKADLGIGFVPEEFLDGVDGVSVIETKNSSRNAKYAC
ncbi:MAG: hypothetical protein MR437_04870 [Clostridiales bacterium]|nr:hypothetical protein [Clostridiales bacterium]